MSVLEILDATIVFDVPGGSIRAVDGVSLSLSKAETLAIVGESGCGKTTLAKAILGLEPLVSGEINVQGEAVSTNLAGLAERVGIVWQDPYASLDPRWRVGRSIAEPLVVNNRFTEDRVDQVMKEVGLEPFMKARFPHQLSGGQRQRVAVARALALNPALVLCDEPTAALDLSIRAQILNLLKSLQKELDCAYLYISHDLTTVRFIADRVAVMYLGKFVEVGPTETLFENPRHPYTRALIASSPTLETLGRLPAVLPGEIPDPRDKPKGCPFKTRCSNRLEACDKVFPEPTIDGSRTFYCHNPVNPTPASLG
ncbi:MAG: ABC transporter ATP-binding protein [Armatimonadota bacterium]|nr:ABC transporter ATP-binding protein [Armatimonadota bacterium]